MEMANERQAMQECGRQQIFTGREEVTERMGRRRIEIKRIEKASRRNAIFSKRRTGLLKKAYELGVLCDSQVAFIIFSSAGKLFEFCNASMECILERYNSLKASKNVTDENKPEELKDGICDERFEMEQSLLSKENLDNMSHKELEDLEQQLSETLLLVKERKEQMFAEQLELSRVQEQHAGEENQTLSTQNVEYKPMLPPTCCAKSDCVDDNLAENQYPCGTLDCGVEIEETNDCLGLSRIATEAAEHSLTGAEKKKKLQIFRRKP